MNSLLVEELADQTVGQLVVQRPSRARVFERFGIDYCCGGKAPLAKACQAKGLKLETIATALRLDDVEPQEDAQNWSAASLSDLVEHIEQTHHTYLKRELPRLEKLARKVASVHGEAHPELNALRDEFLKFKADMESHTLREEQVLFRAIRQLDSGGQSVVRGIAHPIAVMTADHDDAGASLQTMRELTNGYVPPADACGSYRALLNGLDELERDTHVHVHKENEILFPRAIDAEGSSAAAMRK